MALVSQVSRRYAEAVVESALSDGEDALSKLVTELTALAGALSVNNELEQVLMNPAFSTEERVKVLEALMSHLKLSDRAQRFLRVLSDKSRINELSEIAEAVKQIADDRAGQTIAYVETAAELSPAAIEQLKHALEKRTGKKLELEIVLNPELIGGLRARVGTFLLDGSIQTELMRLREQLA